METDNILTKIGDTITAAGKDGLNKAKDIRDYAMIVANIKERENAINKKYTELGRTYYHDHKDDEECAYPQVADISAAYAEIDELQKNKDKLRGIKRCKECGAVLPDDADYCHKCGIRLTPDEVTMEVPAEEKEEAE